MKSKRWNIKLSHLHFDYSWLWITIYITVLALHWWITQITQMKTKLITCRADVWEWYTRWLPVITAGCHFSPWGSPVTSRMMSWRICWLWGSLNLKIYNIVQIKLKTMNDSLHLHRFETVKYTVVWICCSHTMLPFWRFYSK